MYLQDGDLKAEILKYTGTMAVLVEATIFVQMIDECFGDLWFFYDDCFSAIY